MSTDDLPGPVPGTNLHEALRALRARAEKRRHLVTAAAEHHSPSELQRLVQELQVYQIELEMQYEELLLAQAEVHRARTEYIDLYDFAPVGYFTLSPSGLVQRLNLCASQQLGVVRQRLAGRRFAVFVTSADCEAFGQFLAQVMTTEQTQRRELRMQRENGTTFVALLEGLNVADPVAGPQCRLVVLDVTAHRQATQTLQASEARFRTVFEQSHDGILLIADYHYVDANPAALALLGLGSKDAIIGRHVAAFSPEFQPNGQRSADALHACLTQAQDVGWCRFEWCSQGLAGGEVWEEITFSLVETAGQPLVQAVLRDITAARATREQLRDSNARLNQALEATGTGTFTWNLTTNMLEWDERAQAAFGYKYCSGPVPIAQKITRIHPGDQARVLAAVRHAIATYEPLAIDYRVQWPDGSEHYLTASGRVSTNAQGQPQLFAGLLRDVTAERALEDELHYKNLVMTRLLDHLPIVLSRFSPDGRVLEMTGAGLAALHQSADPLAAANLLAVLPDYQTGTLPLLEGRHTNFLSRVQVNEETKYFQNYGFFDEQRQQAIQLSVDVTETELQKQRLQVEKDLTESLLENSIDGIVALDNTGHITAWNKQAGQYFGVEAAAALGRPLLEALPHLKMVGAEQRMARVLAGEQLVVPGMPFVHRPGHYDASLMPLRNQSHEIIGLLAIIRDVTERDRLAEEATQLRLRRQQEVLTAILQTQETERKRIAEALHNGLGQLLYATKLRFEAKPLRPALLREGMELLNDAIRVARTISFELTPGILEDFGLPTALQELAKRIAPRLLHLHLTGLEERLPTVVEIAIYRIVQELFNNALKHAEATEIMLHVVREGSHLEVSVEDNGKGFDLDELAKRPLTGIGLASVRNRVSLLGGSFNLRSRLGQGTIATIEVEV